MRPAPDPGLPPGLIDDVVAMTSAAAADGLPLQSVYDDLREVLDLPAGADLPVEVLRQCALAWAAVQEESTPQPTAAPPISAAVLDDLAWQHALTRADGGGAAALLLEPRAAGDSSLVDPAGAGPQLVAAAADLAARVFDLEGERAVVLAPDSADQPRRVVVLVRAAGLEERTETLRARLTALPGGLTSWHVASVVADATTGGLPLAVHRLLEEQRR